MVECRIFLRKSDSLAASLLVLPYSYLIRKYINTGDKIVGGSVEPRKESSENLE